MNAKTIQNKIVVGLGLAALMLAVMVPFGVFASTEIADLEITAPGDGETVSGIVNFTGIYTDEDGDDSVQWAVRAGTCAAGTGTVYGNVDGKNTAFDWDGENFSSAIDMSGDAPGSYCFVLNPREDSGDSNLRATREFIVEEVDNTAPAMPTGLERYAPDEDKVYACGDESLIQKMWPDWDDNNEDDFDHYEYSSFNPGAQGIDERIFTESVFEYTGSWLPGLGTYGFAVRAVDQAGNKSSWALSDETLEGSCQITYVSEIDDPEPPIDNFPTEKNQCKKGGWMSWLNLFKNQGSCVSYLKSNDKAGKRN